MEFNQINEINEFDFSGRYEFDHEIVIEFVEFRHGSIFRIEFPIYSIPRCSQLMADNEDHAKLYLVLEFELGSINDSFNVRARSSKEKRRKSDENKTQNSI